jgi:hypothetical protein
MKADLYTKVILTVIALCLVVLAWGQIAQGDLISPAEANDGEIQAFTSDASYVTCDAESLFTKCLAVKIYK